jgi:hypothetical protein
MNRDRLHPYCNYCDSLLITPILNNNRLLEKRISTFQKLGCEYSLEILKILVKISIEAESYILIKHPNIYNKLGPRFSSSTQADAQEYGRKIFLFNERGTKTQTHTSCSYCSRQLCEFHMAYGGVEFFKCKNNIKDSNPSHICNNKIIACGWCLQKEKIKYNKVCIECTELSSDVYRLLLDISPEEGDYKCMQFTFDESITTETIISSEQIHPNTDIYRSEYKEISLYDNSNLTIDQDEDSDDEEYHYIGGGYDSINTDSMISSDSDLPV